MHSFNFLVSQSEILDLYNLNRIVLEYFIILLYSSLVRSALELKDLLFLEEAFHRLAEVNEMQRHRDVLRKNNDNVSKRVLGILHCWKKRVLVTKDDMKKAGGRREWIKKRKML